MEKNDQNRTIALAAIFQAAGLVRKLAYSGSADRDQVKTMIESLFSNDAPTIEAIYGSTDQLRYGFKLVDGVLKDPSRGPEAQEITRYAIGLLHLQKQLDKNPDMGKKLIEGIADAQRQLDYFEDSLNPAVISKLADLYKQTISTLGPKIIVKGEQTHLGNEATANEVRALLLAGIRAAVLWQQAGGNKLKLMFSRKKTMEIARRYL